MKLLIRILITALLVTAISYLMKGVVVDESGKPIPYVNIWVEDENIGTTSEENGEFSIIGVENKIKILFVHINQALCIADT